MINQKEFETFLEENDFRMRIEENGEISFWTYDRDKGGKLEEMIKNGPYKDEIKKRFIPSKVEILSYLEKNVELLNELLETHDCFKAIPFGVEESSVALLLYDEIWKIKIIQKNGYLEYSLVPFGDSNLKPSEYVFRLSAFLCNGIEKPKFKTIEEVYDFIRDDYNFFYINKYIGFMAHDWFQEAGKSSAQFFRETKGNKGFYNFKINDGMITFDYESVEGPTKVKITDKNGKFICEVEKNYYTNNLDENTNAENVEKVLYAFLNSSELKPKDY